MGSPACWDVSRAHLAVFSHGLGVLGGRERGGEEPSKNPYLALIKGLFRAYLGSLPLPSLPSPYNHPLGEKFHKETPPLDSRPGPFEQNLAAQYGRSRKQLFPVQFQAVWNCWLAHTSRHIRFIRLFWAVLFLPETA